MSWPISEVKLESISRRKSGPRYDFVERAVAAGTGYRIADDGYFIVAPPESLTPRFVVEISLPELAGIEDYKKLSFDLNDRSSGMLWLDTSDLHAFDLAWRLRLPLRAASPLFAWTKDSKAPSDGPKINIEVPGPGHSKAVRALLDFPVWHGGQTDTAIAEHYAAKQLRIATDDNGDVVGAAVLQTLPENFVALTISVAPDKRNQGIAGAFAAAIAAQLFKDGKTVVAGMANDAPESFRIANRLNMSIVRQAFVAQLGSV